VTGYVENIQKVSKTELKSKMKESQTKMESKEQKGLEI